MKVILQRVNGAKLFVDNKIVSEINAGLILFVGFHESDKNPNMEKLANKIVNLRIFRDSNDKMNLSLKDVDGEIMIVSNFTLYADTTRGCRPNFCESKNPEEAKILYEQFIQIIKQQGLKKVATGIFGAHMHINQENDGPINIVFEI